MIQEQIERLIKKHKEIIHSGDKQRLKHFIIGAHTLYDNIEFAGNKIYLNGELISEVEE